MADRRGVQTYIRCLGLVYDRDLHDWRPCRFLNCPVKLRHKRYQSIDTAVTAKSCRGLTLEGLPCSKSENCPINHAQWQDDIPTGRKRQERRANSSNSGDFSSGDSSSDDSSLGGPGERALGSGSGFSNGNSDANNQARGQQSDTLYGASQGSDTPMYDNASFQNTTSEDHFSHAQVVQETVPVHAVPRPPIYINMDTQDSAPQGPGPALHYVYEAPQTPIHTNMNPRGPSAQCPSARGVDPVHYNTNVAPRTPDNANAQGSPPNVPRYTRQVRKPQPLLHDVHTASRAVQDAMRRTIAHATSHAVQDSTRRIMVPGYEINAPTSRSWNTAQGPDPAYRNVRAGAQAVQQAMHRTFAPIQHTTAATIDQSHRSQGSSPAYQNVHVAPLNGPSNLAQGLGTAHQILHTPSRVGQLVGTQGHTVSYAGQSYGAIEAHPTNHTPSNAGPSNIDQVPNPARQTTHTATSYPNPDATQNPSTRKHQTKDASVTVGAGNFQYFDWQQYDSELSDESPSHRSQAYPAEVRVPDSSSFLNAVQSVSNEPDGLAEREGMSSASNFREFSLSAGEFDGVPEPVRGRVVDWLRDLCLEL